jgi:hypothetical protein
MELLDGRPWMLAYAGIFAVLSASFIKDDIRSQYHPAVVTVSVLAYVLMSFGNFAYALKIERLAPPELWRFLAPAFIVYFVAAGLIDDRYGRLEERYGRYAKSAVINIVAWGIGLSLFLPTFWANMKLAGF